jgi:hypothetical protein
LESTVKLHLNVPRPLLYLSGTGTYGMTEKDIIKQGAKFRCFSYAYVCPGGFYYQKNIKKSLEISIKNGCGIMMDSSAHSFHRLVDKGLRKTQGKWTMHDTEKLRDETIKGYSKFVKKNQKDWDWYVTFDYKKDCSTIYAMQQQLEKLGTNPVPVYHGDQPEEWLKRYCEEGHKLICLGSIKRNNKDMRYYLDRCFNVGEKYGVHLHGLAVTSLSLMFGYPWYSVDSATWAKVAAYGCILCTSESVNDSMGYIHMSNRTHHQASGIEYNSLSPVQRKELEKTVNADGFDLKELMVDGAKRSLYNVFVFSNKIQHLKAGIAESKMKWKSLLSLP